MDYAVALDRIKTRTKLAYSGGRLNQYEIRDIMIRVGAAKRRANAIARRAEIDATILRRTRRCRNLFEKKVAVIKCHWQDFAVIDVATLLLNDGEIVKDSLLRPAEAYEDADLAIFFCFFLDQQFLQLNTKLTYYIDIQSLFGMIIGESGPALHTIMDFLKIEAPEGDYILRIVEVAKVLFKIDSRADIAAMRTKWKTHA
jgi:hypothetical protein